MPHCSREKFSTTLYKRKLQHARLRFYVSADTRRFATPSPPPPSVLSNLPTVLQTFADRRIARMAGSEMNFEQLSISEPTAK
jgi:hypothetical protein